MSRTQFNRTHTIRMYCRAIVASLLIAVIGLGLPLLGGFLLFGLNGVTVKMVQATNLLMGIVGGPMIVFLTRKYYRSQRIAMDELDLFRRRSLQHILSASLIGIFLASSNLVIILLCGGEIHLNSTINWLDIVSGCSTFLGMAILEECIFRGILKEAFQQHGKVMAILLPAALFAAMHMDLWQHFQFIRLLELVTFAIVAGVMVGQTKSLTSVTIMHALYNILIVMLFGIDGKSGLFLTTSPSLIMNIPGEQIISLLFILVQFIMSSVWLSRKSAQYRANKLYFYK